MTPKTIHANNPEAVRADAAQLLGNVLTPAPASLPTRDSWSPHAEPVEAYWPSELEFGAGFAGFESPEASAQRDPMRAAAVWVAIAIVATAAWSLLFAGSL